MSPIDANEDLHRFRKRRHFDAANWRDFRAAGEIEGMA
jgi:hypothetical protein